jgi:transposase
MNFVVVGHNRVLDLRDNAPIQLAYCWAHVRRKLFDLTNHNVPPIAEAGLKQIAALYRIEKHARGTSAEDRLALRQVKSAPKIEAFKTWLYDARAQVSAKSPTGDALKYIAKYWDGLILFLTDGCTEMDSNAVESTIRPIALQSKNALFAGHGAGTQNWSMLASLIEACKLNYIEPHSYLTGVLTAIVNGHKQKHIDQLLPWNVKT